MQAIVEWKDARRKFYWRLRRRLLEERLKRKMREACANNRSDTQIDAMIYRLFNGNINPTADDNATMVSVCVCVCDVIFIYDT